MLNLEKYVDVKFAKKEGFYNSIKPFLEYVEAQLLETPIKKEKIDGGEKTEISFRSNVGKFSIIRNEYEKISDAEFLIFLIYSEDYNFKLFSDINKQSYFKTSDGITFFSQEKIYYYDKDSIQTLRNLSEYPGIYDKTSYDENFIFPDKEFECNFKDADALSKICDIVIKYIKD